MLTISKDHILSGRRKNGAVIGEPINPEADIYLFGQEVNPETFALCKSDLFMKSTDGQDAKNIAFGSTLSNDRHSGRSFDYLIANPPYGKDWKRDEEAVTVEHERGPAGRFGPGLPRISDGQLLFLLHMIAHIKEPKEGGSRVAIIMNGSPLFTGDAGSGESEIRRFVLENDLLEALIAVPEQLFYNTGIATYIWVLTNRKAAKRKDKVQLIDATSFWIPMRKSLGDKRREIPPEKAGEILRLLGAFEEGEFVKTYPTTHFGFRKITVERPLRLNFQASPERIARLEEERAFQNLAQSKKKGEAAVKEQAEGRGFQEEIRSLLRKLPNKLFKDREEFLGVLEAAAKKSVLKLPAPIIKAILVALSERDETAAVCRDKDGNPEPDSELRDTESVPLVDGPDPADAQSVPASVRAFFEREVQPHVPDAWIDSSRRDPKDGLVGLIGYEINFNRYFYKYVPPRPLEEIEADIRAIEKDIMRMLAEVTGGG
jgi:type I restriction enzyme M protein